MKSVDDFKEKGFHIEKNVFERKEMEDLFFTFYDIAYSIAKREGLSLNDFIEMESLNYPNNIKDLDKILMDLFYADKNLIGEVYDTFSYSMAFMRFLGNEKVESVTKELLELSSQSALYGWTNRVRIDPPHDERRTYGWHQEIFYTMPNTRFLQTWCPILRDTTKENGTINIKAGSHKEGVAASTWNEEEDKAIQITVDSKLTNKYPSTELEMKVGDILFFDGHLFHKSGKNTTKSEIRFSLVGMWNDVSHKGFKAPIPDFKFRTISSKENFEKHFKSS
tara:strand:+ start:8777 stop:9613 length:837 start_codon:yes stop_codon:yes gene_type:complete